MILASILNKAVSVYYIWSLLEQNEKKAMLLWIRNSRNRWFNFMNRFVIILLNIF